MGNIIVEHLAIAIQPPDRYTTRCTLIGRKSVTTTRHAGKACLRAWPQKNSLVVTYSACMAFFGMASTRVVKFVWCLAGVLLVSCLAERWLHPVVAALRFIVVVNGAAQVVEYDARHQDSHAVAAAFCEKHLIEPQSQNLQMATH